MYKLCPRCMKSLTPAGQMNCEFCKDIPDDDFTKQQLAAKVQASPNQRPLPLF